MFTSKQNDFVAPASVARIDSLFLVLMLTPEGFLTAPHVRESRAPRLHAAANTGVTLGRAAATEEKRFRAAQSFSNRWSCFRQRVIQWLLCQALRRIDAKLNRCASRTPLSAFRRRWSETPLQLQRRQKNCCESTRGFAFFPSVTVTERLMFSSINSWIH